MNSTKFRQFAFSQNTLKRLLSSRIVYLIKNSSRDKFLVLLGIEIWQRLFRSTRTVGKVESVGKVDDLLNDSLDELLELDMSDARWNPTNQW